ncbi:phospholipase/carboxylesterase family protein (macronuclear) [Tetrahymena thermophila SB210]|uniref:Phospholipase/carboxylesterase family protein n=1 Tax=Tetrahymena thermophila (strain SB210) TaxID=312017 RepID=Q22BW3_TETTS|nr:phospholipase/carboxylesterase family protein [Tetrahymena thermophila SB210]EAR82795.2 phospholipase/carboxylesterase family protein [Tetrahymena thermophila SB210]|eukprot:XP_001030458.2 phospholipase/carboxylesterase family protein [Tetrahymena thermophila SB210]
MFGGINKYKVEKKGDDIYLIPKGQHTHTLVWMHGLGDTAEGYLDFFGESSSPTPDNMKIVLLTAPTRKVTINMGMQMPSWFDFKAFQVNEQNFHQAIGVEEANESAQRIQQVLNEEIAKLNGDSKKVFLGGFSQGGCMTLRAGLTFDKPLGGLIVYSGFLFPTIVDHESNKNTEILISHGEQDPLLPWAQSKQSYTKLNEQTHKVRWEIIKNLQHTFNERSLIVFQEFVKAHL